MNLKELQQKINELVEQGHGDAIVCSYWTDTGRFEEVYKTDIETATYQSSTDGEHYVGKILELC